MQSVLQIRQKVAFWQIAIGNMLRQDKLLMQFSFQFNIYEDYFNTCVLFLLC